MATLLQDLKYGLRMLAKNPGFTLVAVTTLALGIAVNTTMFSAVSATLLRKPPVKNPDSLCEISSKELLKGYDLESVSPLDFESWKNQNHVFQAMAAGAESSFTLTGKGRPESVIAARVSANFFDVAGVAPELGRAFVSGDAKAGADHVVILSDELWRARFGSNPGVIGSSIEVNGEPYTIIGVMPQSASLPMPYNLPEMWTPLVFSAKELTPPANGFHNLQIVLGRLKPGDTVEKAQAEMDSIARRLATSHPETDKNWGITVLTLQEYLIRKPRVRNALVMLMTVVGFVLLIACANIAGLLLARGAGRTHELAVRSAVGASRFRLIRQMLAESLLIGAAGGGAGLLMSVWGISLLRAGFNFNALGSRMAAGFRLDQPTLVFALAVTFLTTIVFGLLPAIRASKANPRNALSESGRTGSSGSGHSRLRSALVTAEIALALLLLAGAGIMMRELVHEYTEPNGFNPNNLLAASIDLNAKRYQKPAAQVDFFRRVVENVRSLPGVESASVNTCAPLGCNWSTSFSIAGEPPLPASKRPTADFFAVGPDYFRTMQIPLLQGRYFSDSEDAGSPVVAIVNREFARRFFPKGDAIGRQMEVDEGRHKLARIVGIVGNTNSYVGQSTPHPQIYESYQQIPFGSMAVVLRSREMPAAISPLLRRAVWSVDKDQPVVIQTMHDLTAANVGGDKLMVGLMGIFAGLALVLAVVGIYGVIAFSVAQRTREIGIRMALGAQKADVLGLVLRQGGLLAGIGCAIGILLAFPLPRLFSAMFYGFSTQGPLVAIAVAFIVAAASLLACYIPARRAAKVDPMEALRYE